MFLILALKCVNFLTFVHSVSIEYGTEYLMKMAYRNLYHGAVPFDAFLTFYAHQGA